MCWGGAVAGIVPGQTRRETPGKEGGRYGGKNNSGQLLKPQKAGGHGAVGKLRLRPRSEWGQSRA